MNEHPHLDEYWSCVCERDVSWKIYTKFPTDNTWSNYILAVEAEKKAEKEISLDGFFLCACGNVIKIGSSCEYRHE